MALENPNEKKGGVARPGLHAGALFRDAALGLIGHQEDLAGWRWDPVWKAKGHGANMKMALW